MRMTLDTCPDKAKHTRCPVGYVAWHEWAEKKAETHVQEQCPTCGLWAIWQPAYLCSPKPEASNV